MSSVWKNMFLKNKTGAPDSSAGALLTRLASAPAKLLALAAPEPQKKAPAPQPWFRCLIWRDCRATSAACLLISTSYTIRYRFVFRMFFETDFPSGKFRCHVEDATCWGNLTAKSGIIIMKPWTNGESLCTKKQYQTWFFIPRIEYSTTAFQSWKLAIIRQLRHEKKEKQRCRLQLQLMLHTFLLFIGRR